MHERLKHLHHISFLSQSSLFIHWQSESKFPKKKLWRWSCDSLAGGSSERACRVLDSCWWSSSVLFQPRGKRMSAHWVWGWMSAVKGLGGPQYLPTAQGLFEVTKVYRAGWVYSISMGWLVCLFLPESLSEMQNNNSSITTGCKHTAKQDLVQINMLILAEGPTLVLWEQYSKSHHIQITNKKQGCDPSVHWCIVPV